MSDKLSEQEMRLLISDNPFPWSMSRHPDPDCSVRHIVDANGHQVCTFYQDLSENIRAVRFILHAVAAQSGPPHD